MILPRPPSGPRRAPMPRRRAIMAMTREDWQEEIVRLLGLLSLYGVFLAAILLSWTTIPVLELTPFWALIPLFTWSLIRPELMPGALVFAVGILSDIVIGTPLGVHALGLLGIQILVRFQQRFLLTQNFFLIWVNFALLSMLFIVVTTLLSLLSLGADGDLGGVIASAFSSWVLLVLLFPPLSAVSHAMAGLGQHGK